MGKSDIFFWTSTGFTILSIILNVMGIVKIEKYRQEYLKAPSFDWFRIDKNDTQSQINALIKAINDNERINKLHDDKRSVSTTYIIFGFIAAIIAAFFNSLLYFQSTCNTPTG